MSVQTRPYRKISTADDNATVVNPQACKLTAGLVINLNAAVRYLKIYDKASAPTSSDTPVLTFPIPSQSSGLGGGFTLTIPQEGCNFLRGLAFRLTTGIADNDTGAVAANEIVVNLFHGVN